MAESDLSLTLNDLKIHVAINSRWDRTPGNWSANQILLADAAIEAGLRQAYSPPPIELRAGRGPQRARSHRWNFMRPMQRMFTVAPYNTGSVTIVDGVVTLAGGTFPTWLSTNPTDGALTIGNVSYEVASYTNTTTCTLADTSIDKDAGTGYKLVRFRYQMDDDFAGIEGELHYRVGSSNTYGYPLDKVNWDYIRDLRDDWEVTSDPRVYAIYPLEYDEDAGLRYYMSMYPIADEIFEFVFRARLTYNVPSANAKYPLGGMYFAELLRYSVLDKADEMINSIRGGPHHQAFLEALPGAITTDIDASAPTTLGPDGVTVADQPAFFRRSSNDYILPSGHSFYDQ